MNRNLMCAGFLGLVAAIVYFVWTADSAFPAKDASLLAPIGGVVAVVTFYCLVRRFISFSSVSCGEMRSREGEPPATLAAVAASVIFMLSPAVRLAATHFAPRMCDFAWALLIAALAFPFLSRRGVSAAPGLYALLSGSAVALGFLDSALFLALSPLYLALVAHVSRRVGIPAAPDQASRPSVLRLFSVPVFLFALSALLTFFAAVLFLHIDLSLFLRRTLIELTAYYKIPGWFFVFAFTTLPFLTVLFSEDGALRERPGSVQLLFHGALSFVTILAVVPPLSPFALMEPYGRLPVATSAFAAAVAGYLIAYWWINRRMKTACVLGGILCLVLAGSAVWNVVSFERNAAAFANRITRRVLIKMDGRRAQEILRKDPDSPFANYVMGSLALGQGRIAEAETYLRKATDIPEPVPFALNDLAEALRRGKNYAEAERYARQCVERAPKMYVAWETLGSVLMDAGKDLEEAESAIRRACELSKGKDGKSADVRMLFSLARVQLRRRDSQGAAATIRMIRSRQNELSDSERAEFEKVALTVGAD